MERAEPLLIHRRDLLGLRLWEAIKDQEQLGYRKADIQRTPSAGEEKHRGPFLRKIGRQISLTLWKDSSEEKLLFLF